MKILIDGDSCNKLQMIEAVSKQNGIECHVYHDGNHLLQPEYAISHIVEQRSNSADFAIANACQEGDVVITNDSGLAAMILAKRGIPVHQSGMVYTSQNIMTMLNRRYLRQKSVQRTKRLQVHGIEQIKNSKTDLKQVLLTKIQKCEVSI